MKTRLLVIAIALTFVVHGLSFASPLRDRQIGTEAQTVDPAIEYNTLSEQVNNYIDTEDYTAAIPLLKRMHELKPRELMPVEYLGILYSNIPEERPELANALFWLLEAEKMYSSYNIVYYNFACVYSLKNDLEKSVAAMEKSIVFGYSSIEWMSQDEDLINFRTTSWWEGIADNYVQIGNLLTTFNGFANTAVEKSFEERIDFYSAIIASLVELAPHIPALRCNPTWFLAISYVNQGDYTHAEGYYLEVLDIVEHVLGTDHPNYATSLSNMGVLYDKMGDYAQAERYYREALSIQERVLGKDHPDYATSLSNIGGLYDNMGDYAQAELYYWEALNIQESVLGKDHPDYATSLSNIGGLYYNMGDYAKAEVFFLETASIRERVLGNDHPSYATSLNKLGLLYYNIGDYAKAEPFLLETVSIRERALGKDHPDYASSLNNLGLLYDNMGDYARAERYLLEATIIFEKALDTYYHDYATSLNNLGLLYHNMGDYAQAERYYQEATSIYETALGKDHRDYANSLNNLGTLYWSMSDYARAERYYIEALSIRERILGTDHPDYAASMHSLGVLYHSMGDYARTERYLLEALSIEENTLGKDHPNYATSLNNLGGLYSSMGDYARAERYYMEALSIRERVLGKDNPNYANTLNNLGSLYNDMGEYIRAEYYLLEALSIKENTLGKDHPDYAISLSNLGHLYSSMGDYARAERYYLEASSIYETKLGKDHPNYATSLNNLGALYHSIGDYAQAELYYLEGLRIRGRILGTSHPDYATLLHNLGALYSNMGDYAKAERYYMEAAGIWEKVLGKDHPSFATSLDKLGGLYSSMGDLAQAERYYLEAAGIREKALGKDHPSYATSLNNLGVFYCDIGDYTRAEPYYLEALNIYEKALGKDNPDYSLSLNNLGVLYSRLGDYANTEDKRLEFYTNAEFYLLEAADIREKTLGKDHPDFAILLNSLGTLYYSMGDYNQTERYFLEGLSVTERALGKDHPDYAMSLNNLGALYNSLGDYAQAERYHLEALSIRGRVLGTGHPDYVSSLDHIYGLFLAKREYIQAIPFKQEAYQLNTEQVNRNFSFLSEQQRNAYWNANAGSFETTYSLSWHYPVPESNALSYENALFSKGLLLRTTNAVRDAIFSSGDDALIAQFEELGQLRRQISAMRQSGGNEEYIQSLEQQAEALDKSLTQSSTVFREFRTDLAVGWQNVRDSLQPNEAAIEFVSFRIYDQRWTNTPQYAALVLRPGMDSPVWIPLCEESTLKEIFGKLDELKLSWTGPDNELQQAQIRLLYDEYGPALYNAVWRPLEEVLQGVTTVYYSPSGLLNKVSFSAIPVGDDSRLMDVYNLNMVSSTREVVYRQNNAAQLPRSAVVYGGLLYDLTEDRMRQEALAYQNQGTQISSALPQNFTRGGTWSYLFYTSTESNSIHRQLNDSNISAVLYNAARGNKESFKSLDGMRTGIIHLATHGFFQNDIERNYEEQERLRQLGGGNRAVENPLMRSGLILAGGNNAWSGSPVEGIENGILFADDVARMNLLGAEIVVLSACETGLGEVDNSEGVFGLQRAFKLAGAQTLVMSLWEVSDDATTTLMEQFYRNWLGGKSKQEAMKEAQRVLRADPRYESPFYWAAFVVMD